LKPAPTDALCSYREEGGHGAAWSGARLHRYRVTISRSPMVLRQSLHHQATFDGLYETNVTQTGRKRIFLDLGKSLTLYKKVPGLNSRAGREQLKAGLEKLVNQS
jgi:hypothetical protein